MASYETACCGARVNDAWLRRWEKAEQEPVCPRCKERVRDFDDCTRAGDWSYNDYHYD